jgi:hypothetical protein
MTAVARFGGVAIMNFCRIATLSALGMVALIEPVFAGNPTPGPIAGVGLPAMAIIGGAYWLGRKLLARKN